MNTVHQLLELQQTLYASKNPTRRWLHCIRRDWIFDAIQRYSPLELTAKIAFLPGVVDVVRMIYREPVLETGHINLLTAAQVTAQLERPGFKIREQHKSGLYLPLLAEFAGKAGPGLEQWLEPRLRDSPLDWLLWTQYFVAEA